METEVLTSVLIRIFKGMNTYPECMLTMRKLNQLKDYLN